MKPHSVKGQADSHKTLTKDFIHKMNDVCRREGLATYDAFFAFAEAGNAALRNPIYRMVGDEKAWQKNEDNYMRIVNRCRHKTETMTDYAQMLAILTRAFQIEKRDFLSNVFMEVGANANLGQFHTPWDLCLLMAQMGGAGEAASLLKKVKAEEGRDFILMSEPAVGVGTMVLAAHVTMEKNGLKPHLQSHWQVTDVDWRYICSAYIQLTLAGVSAHVIHGNTLSKDPPHDVCPTMMALIHPKVRH